MSVLRFNTPLDPTKRSYYLVGHFNPLSTLLCLIIGDVQTSHALVFWFSQLFGSITACIALVTIIPDSQDSSLGSLDMGTNIAWYTALFVEFAISFFFILGKVPVGVSCVFLHYLSPLHYTPLTPRLPLLSL
jgi:glycerol uptake facilitator-like aquaporin